MKKASRSLKRLMTYIDPYKSKFIMVLFLIFFTVVFNTILPYVSGLPITKIAENISRNQSIDFQAIIAYLMAIFLIGLGYAGSQMSASFMMTTVVQESMQDMRKDIEKKINRLPVSYFDKNQQGDILSRVTNDVDSLSNAMQQSFIAILSALLGIVMSAGMMFYINPIMAAFALTMIPLSLIISKVLIQVSQNYFQKQQNTLGEMNGFVQERMTGFNVLKAFGQEKESLSAFKTINHRLNFYGFRSAFISGMMMPLVQLTAYSSYIGSAVLGSLYVIQGVIVIGQLQAFVQYVWQVSQPMGTITQMSAVLQSASAAIDRIFEILDEPEEKPNEIEVPLPADVKGEVEFDHVSFQYDPKIQLIEDLSFSVKAGQTVAIVGPTGAGKTTLINLLLRFYDVTSGAIRIDGVDINTMKRGDVRSLFGLVLQDAWLFPGSIRDNIRFGKLSATEYDIVDAAKTANVDHFIRTLPDGYDMMINDEGSNVSLGQKQLLTIARAIIADPKILILDEATSSVDTRLEALIQTAMQTVMKGRTSFVIAHRLSTIREADLILVMDQGQIIEQGTHTELLAAGGFYEKLYNSQFAEEQE